jgi:hypothetical protein
MIAIFEGSQQSPAATGTISGSLLLDTRSSRDQITQVERELKAILGFNEVRE